MTCYFLDFLLLRFLSVAVVALSANANNFMKALGPLMQNAGVICIIIIYYNGTCAENKSGFVNMT